MSHKLCRIARSSRAHRTESVSVMGHLGLIIIFYILLVQIAVGHSRSAEVCSTEWDQKQRNIVVHMSLVLPDRHCAAIVNGTIAFEAVVAVANVLDGPMSSSDQSVCSGQVTAGIGLQVRTNPTLSPQPLQYI